MAKDSLRVVCCLLLAVALSGCPEGKDGKDGIHGSNGKDATPALMNTSTEPPSVNCPAGGSRIDSGLDVNLNGTLDTAEIQTTSYICHGADGSNGTNGSDGLTALINTTSEPAGTNCPAGGYKVESGLDANSNSTLDAAEVQGTSYLCNGEDGADGLLSLVSIQSEPAGTNCTNGGQRIDSGLDTNGNGMLDAAEQNTAYVCNGTNGEAGADGLNALVSVIGEPAGANCEVGGYRLDSGLDANANNALDTAEIQNTSYVCNGTSGGIPSYVSIGGLNDTGMDACGDYAYSGSGIHQNYLDCDLTGATTSNTGVDANGDPVPAGQDAHFGRDARAANGTLIKIGAGHAGFDFTKIDSNGDPLPASASGWNCVRDNVTGLMWEVKATDGGLRDTSHTYTWYNSSGSNNGSNPGTPNGGTCVNGTDCDTEKFVAAVNAVGLCGFNDWRLPSDEELLDITTHGRTNPAIDTDFFPNTATSNSYWSSSPYAGSSLLAWTGYFNLAGIGTASKSGGHPVRVVRSN